MSAQRHLFVGDPKAVQILARKILTKSRGELVGQRIVRAATKAQARYGGVQAQGDLGFYHGLLTGYAVALKTLEGKAGRIAR